MAAIVVTSNAFTQNQPVPRKYTGDGQNVSPPLAWSGVPAETRQLALIVDDPDAPSPQPWVHWVLYQLAANATSLPEGVPPSQRVADPAGGLQGRNSWGRVGYGGPEPPRGHGTHHYHFKLHALDTELKLAPGLDKSGLLKAMEGHILGTGELVGTYER
jgi:Raf kinase inhibitor-like YbhB/YbcL family protein